MSFCTIKVVIGSLDEARQIRFASALKLARRCTHPNIAEVLEGGTSPEGLSYFVESNIPGLTLSQTLRSGPLSLPRTLGIACQLLDALARIHDFGGCHGDIHPNNVVVSNDDYTRLLDVGLGRSLIKDPWENDPRVLAAQSFLAPERSSNAPANAASDIYSIGALVYHMLTGRLPVEADDVTELRSLLASSESDPCDSLPEMPSQIQEWLMSLLCRDVAGRVENAHQALIDLKERASQCSVALPEITIPSKASGTIALDAEFDRWSQFRQVFEQMVALGYPQGPPPPTSETLLALIGRVSQLDEIAKNTLYHYGLLEDVDQRARQARQQIASQMDNLNDRTTQLRIDLHPLKVAAARHAEKVESFPEQMKELHKKVVNWEGRCAFAEPYPQLSEAYRAAADLIDKWHNVRQAQLTCVNEASEREEEIAQATEELSQLRESLRVSESNLEGERAACVSALANLGRQADELHMDLMNLAARFSAPLRSKPELGPCFQQLQQAQ